MATHAVDARGQQPVRVYLKLELDEPIISFLKNPDRRTQRLKDTASDLIRMIRDNHSRRFNWEFEAADPADNVCFPEVRIELKENTGVGNWYMHVRVNSKPGPNGLIFHRVSPELLKRGDLPSGHTPAAKDGRLWIEVQRWFMEHFAADDGNRSLLANMRREIALCEARFNAKADPSLQPGEGVVLLPFGDYQHLSDQQFRLEFLDQRGTRVVRKPFLGQGFRKVDLNGAMRELIYIKYGNAPEQLNGIVGGPIFLEPTIPASQLRISES
jgi:hypothetical protein